MLSQLLLVSFFLLYYTFFMNINKSYSKKIVFIFSFFILLVNTPLFSKSKNKSDKYIKYVHPRIYEFDLCDADTQVFLGYNKYSGKFEADIDYTRFVKGDLPQAGDKVIFYFKGYSKKPAHLIYGDVYDGNRNLTNSFGKVFIPYIEKNTEFEGSVSYILSGDVTKEFRLHLWSSMPDQRGKLDQCYLNFTRVVETTDTVSEAAQEKKAAKKNIEIVEVQSEIFDDDEIAAQEAAKAAAIEAEKLAAEEAEKAAAEEAARIAAEQEAARIEKERLEAERLKQEEELQKAIDSVKAVSRYEKEFLNDYMVLDEPDISEPEEAEEELIANPDETDSFGRTLLMKAAKAGNDWQIKTLLKSGANVNLKDKDGWTALMYAVRYQESMVCVDLLIDAGADVKKYNKYNSSALSLAACYNNNPEVLKKLLSYYSTSDKEVLKSLVLLLSENQTSEYIQLAKLDIYLNLSIPLNNFYEGKTPLMYAAEFGTSTKVIKSLLDSNAILNIRSTEGKTAYDYASANKNLKHDDNYWALNKK